jgi:hypothetical protein
LTISADGTEVSVPDFFALLQPEKTKMVAAKARLTEARNLSEVALQAGIKFMITKAVARFCGNSKSGFV